MSAIKIAIVGPGLIGTKHIDLVFRNPDTKLCAIVAPDRPHNHQIARQLGVNLRFDLLHCLERDQVDAVIICSPNPFHYEQAHLCLERDVPVLIEKPVTTDIEEGRRLTELSHERRSRALVGHHRAYSPFIQVARRIIKEGRLGRLVSLVGSAQFHKPTKYFQDGPWRSEIGGGPILINMIHEVGNMRTLMGEIDAVQALSSSAVRNFPVEDTVAMNFHFSSGALGVFLLSDTAATAKSWEQTSGENPSYPHYHEEDCYSIAGTRGSLSIPTMRMKYALEGIEASWWTPFEEESIELNKEDPLALQLRHFVEVIRGNCEPWVSVEDGFRNLVVTEAIKTAIKTGCVVRVGH
jgi:predicted dehydrogenase